jgi:hydrogenase maturation protease
MVDSPILVIGYGNSLRCDDGVGPYLAETIAQKAWPGVQTLAVHQLTPELAPQIAQATKVIFIDAIANRQRSEVIIEVLEPKDNYSGLDHSGNPSYLLALAKHLYGHCPPSFWVLIPAQNFEFGEYFSVITTQAMIEALAKIFTLIFEADLPHETISLGSIRDDGFCDEENINTDG